MPPEPSNDDMMTAVQRALEWMKVHDAHLFDVDGSERSLTFRLGCYMQQEFPKWNVDSEYNRNGEVPKALKAVLEDVKRRKPDTKSKGHVFPDLILHRRGPAGPNLLVIEAKKESERTPENEAFDRLKLAAYQDELHYRVAAFIVFGTDENNPTYELEFQTR